MMKATIELKFSVGISIKEAFFEAIRIAKILGIATEFKFNGVTCWGHPEGDEETGELNYFKALKRKDQYKYAPSKSATT